MSDTTTTYASSMGRLKAMSGHFLARETLSNLLGARDIPELARMMDGTSYSPDVTRANETYQNEVALEVAIARHFVTAARFAYEAAPFAGRSAIAAYLRFWDIENVVAILAAKAYGRLVTESETYLISDRQTPAGITAGVMTQDEIRNLLAQPTVEGVVQQLTKFGYGITVMEHLENFLKSKDIFPVSRALEKEYYLALGAQSKFFQGDEWVVRQFVSEEINSKNILTLLKGKESGLTTEAFGPLFIEGGSLSVRQLTDLASLKGVEEVVSGLDPALGLGELLPEYRERQTLVPFDIALRRLQLTKSLTRMRSYPLSLAGLFHFILLARSERADLRKIIYGKVYQIPNEHLSKELVLIGS